MRLSGQMGLAYAGRPNGVERYISSNLNACAGYYVCPSGLAMILGRLNLHDVRGGTNPAVVKY